MMIRRLNIKNFRGVKSGEIDFSQKTVLIGANNSGKTTILEAIALLFGRDRMIRTLTEHDFFGSDPKASDRIRIVATLSGFDGDDPDRNPDWFRPSRGVPKWISTETGALSAAKEHENDRLAVQIGFDARFDRETLEVATVRYFFDDTATGDPFDEESVTPFPNHLVREIGFFFVPANRTWDKMMSFGSELFRRVVNYAGGKPSSTVLKERDALRNPIPEMQDDENIKDLVAEIDSDLSSLLGRKTGLKLRLTNTDSAAVLDAISPHYLSDTDHILPSRRQGDGLVSLQSLVLLLRFGHIRAAAGDPFILAIEEPELHVPPPLQQRVAQKIETLATQSILTTHSPIVASYAAPETIRILQNDRGTIAGPPLLAAPLSPTAGNVERILFGAGLQATVSAIMHPYLLIPEGKIDALVLRAMAHAITSAAAGGDGTDFAAHVGLLETPDSRMGRAFDALRLAHGSIACLVDGDQGGRDHCAELLGKDVPPAKILEWPEDWAIEDVIGWALSADVAVLADPLIVEFNLGAEVAAAITRLKTETKDGGSKGDALLIANLIAVMAQSAGCRQRIMELLTGMLEKLSGANASAGRFTRSAASTARTAIWTFVP